MAFSKSTDYPHKLAVVSATAKLIAHPARITLLRQLQQGPATLVQLTEDHPLRMVSVSNHLRALMLAGIVQVHTKDQKAIYMTQPHAWPTLITYAVRQASNLNYGGVAA